MKIANLITAYKDPGQIARLIRTMNHPNFDFFVHLDGNVDIANYLFLEQLDQVRLIKKRTKVVWGGYSFTKAILSSIEEISDSSESYAFINLLSSQDYPIKPVGQFYAFLEGKQGNSFIAYQNDRELDWLQKASPRYERYNLNDYTFKGRYFFQGLLNQFLPKRIFPLNAQIYGSSCATWWTINMDCALYIINFIKLNTRLDRYMRLTWGADKFLIPTILMNSPLRNSIINDNLRHIDWSLGGANPKILNSKDLPILQETEAYFARKFDIRIDDKILDEIDNALLVKDKF